MTKGLMDGWMTGWTDDKGIDGWMDEWMNGWTDDKGSD